MTTTCEVFDSATYLTTKDTYKGVSYMIRSMRRPSWTFTIYDQRDGFTGCGHFMAYVQIDDRLEKDEDLEGYAHWGYTYMGGPDWPTDDKPDPGMCVVGWDYAHLNDDWWNYEDVLKEVKEFIDAYLEKVVE